MNIATIFSLLAITFGAIAITIPLFILIMNCSYHKALSKTQVSAGGGMTIDLESTLIPGSIFVKVNNKDKDILYIGRDYDKNGVVVLVGSYGRNRVDYTSGVVTLNGIIPGVVTVSALPRFKFSSLFRTL